MGYSILKYGRTLLTDIEGPQEAMKEALRFVTPITGSEFVEIRDSVLETVTIGYFDGRRFHWTRDKSQTEVWKTSSFVTKPPLWKDSKDEGREGRREC